MTVNEARKLYLKVREARRELDSQILTLAQELLELTTAYFDLRSPESDRWYALHDSVELALQETANNLED